MQKKQFSFDYGFVANSRHFDQMFTIGEQTYIEPQVGWCQIFCRLIAANKYLASQIFSPTNDVQVRIFEYDRIFVGERRFRRNFFIITLVLR